LVREDGPNPCRFFQIWMNLPAKSKMVEPEFVMAWDHLVPRVLQEGVKVSTYSCGALFLAPPFCAGADPCMGWVRGGLIRVWAGYGED
jgi:hypothetical protein